MKTIVLVFATLLTVIFSMNVFAWGQRERDVLKGIAAGVSVVVLHNHVARSKNIPKNSQRAIYRNPERRSPSGIDNHRHAIDCYDNPYCHNPRLAKAYERGRQKRRIEVERQLAKEAYERGYRDY